MPLVETFFPSPVGELTLVASDAGLVAILWQDDDPARVRLPTRELRPHHPMLIQASAELTAYFTGRLTQFTVPLDFRGTDFQQKVWAALLAIPFGQTRSYGDVARAINHPTASRAVGAANGRNPISIITPCHRVVGTSGALTGFAGGVNVKRWLLDFERRGANKSVPAPY
jgi:methylated-DNA-[protein]-cysteine S-methyltransferase